MPATSLPPGTASAGFYIHDETLFGGDTATLRASEVVLDVPDATAADGYVSRRAAVEALNLPANVGPHLLKCVLTLADRAALDPLKLCLETECVIVNPAPGAPKRYVLRYAPHSSSTFYTCKDGNFNTSDLTDATWYDVESLAAARANVPAITSDPASVAVGSIGTYTPNAGAEGFYLRLTHTPYAVPTGASGDLNWRQVAPPVAPTSLTATLTEAAFCVLYNDQALGAYTGKLLFITTRATGGPVAVQVLGNGAVATEDAYLFNADNLDAPAAPVALGITASSTTTTTRGGGSTAPAAPAGLVVDGTRTATFTPASGKGFADYERQDTGTLSYVDLPSPALVNGKIAYTVPGTAAATEYVRLKAAGGLPAGTAASSAVPAIVLFAAADVHVIGDSLVDSSRGGATGADLLQAILRSRLAGFSQVTITTHGFSGHNALWMRGQPQFNSITSTFDHSGGKKVVCYLNFAANDVINFGGAQYARDQAALLTADLYAAGADFVYVIEPMNREDTNAADYFTSTGRTFDADRLLLRDLERANLPKYHDGTVALNEAVLGRSTAPDNDFYFALGDVDGLSKVHLTGNGNHWYAEPIAQHLAVRLQVTLPAVTLPVPTTVPTLLAWTSGTSDTAYDSANHRAYRSSGGGSWNAARFASLALGDISASVGFVGNYRIPDLFVANGGVVTGLEQLASLANVSYDTLTGAEYWDTSGSWSGYSNGAAVTPGASGITASLGAAKIAVTKTATDVVFDFYLGGVKRSTISIVKSAVTWPLVPKAAFNAASGEVVGATLDGPNLVPSGF